jgi:type II secretory pathway component GspD/PulD (secretin)
MIMIMHREASVEEMHVRSYPVLSSFMDRMTTAQTDVDEYRANNSNNTGFSLTARTNANNDSAENKEQDWKEFFSLMSGIDWPEGSSIMYIKTLGKLRVRNTLENLAELENALNELNIKPTLIEIEARFVEVCQDDLNSLGFEWILNSDYTMGLGSHASKVLGINNGTWSSASSSAGTTPGSASSGNSNTGGWGTTGGGTSSGSSTPANSGAAYYANSSGATWIRGAGSRGSVGFNRTGGDSGYGMNNRYLSTLGNHISGEGYSTNDQFMKVNAFLGSADLSMILHMLSQRSDTDLLSAPKVLTRSEEQAVIKVVTLYRYPRDYDVQLQSSSSSSSSYGGGSQSSILAIVEPGEFDTQEVGVILDVTPRLTEDGNLIDLQLNTQVIDEPTWKNYGMRIPFTGNSSLQNFEGIGGIFEGLTGILDSIGGDLDKTVKEAFAQRAVESATSALDSLTTTSSDNLTYYDAPMEQPFFHIRSIESKVSVYPGATIVMGGLITEQRKAMDDKVPFLGDIPFVGRLFRSHSEFSSKRNLLIFVTTRLVDAHGREIKLSTTAANADDASVKSAPEK